MSSWSSHGAIPRLSICVCQASTATQDLRASVKRGHAMQAAELAIRWARLRCIAMCWQRRPADRHQQSLSALTFHANRLESCRLHTYPLVWE